MTLATFAAWWLGMCAVFVTLWAVVHWARNAEQEQRRIRERLGIE